MFYQQKLDIILELLEVQPYWTSKDLSIKLDISRSTVQRCLDDLHQSGLAERIHGGIRKINGSTIPPIPLNERNQLDTDAKQIIGRCALPFVGSQGYVYLDAGTTVLPLSQQLNKSQHQQVHFVTNDVSIALILAQKQLDHTLLGGRLHPITQTISGPASQAQITEFHFDVCFISADGIDPQHGVTCSLNDEAHLKRQAMKQSTQKVLLGSSAKWEHCAGSRISKLEDFNIFITEQAASKIQKISKQMGLQIITGQSKI
jgi:DeoR family fructose operon transcriptional repressor